MNAVDLSPSQLSVGSNTDGIEVRSVGNTQTLKETALIEAFNLKVGSLQSYPPTGQEFARDGVLGYWVIVAVTHTKAISDSLTAEISFVTLTGSLHFSIMAGGDRVYHEKQRAGAGGAHRHAAKV